MTPRKSFAIHTVTLHGLDIACELFAVERSRVLMEAAGTECEHFALEPLAPPGLRSYEEKHGGARVEVIP